MTSHNKLPDENVMLIQIQAALAMADMQQMALVASKCNPHAFVRTMAIYYLGLMLAQSYAETDMEIPNGMDYHQYAINVAFANAAIQHGVVIIENNNHVNPSEDDPPLDDVWINWGEGRE